MAKKEKDNRGLSMQDLRGAMAEEHPERDAGMSAFMAMTSDTVEEQQPEGTYRFALNGVMEDRETAGRLQNEESNEECIDITGNDLTEYSLIVDTCCDETLSFVSDSIIDASKFVDSLGGGCDGFVFEGYSIGDNVFVSLASLMTYIEKNGFGTYRIGFVGCAENKHVLIISNCCGDIIEYEYPDGTELDPVDIVEMDCKGYITCEYSIYKGDTEHPTLVESHIPIMSPRNIVMNDNFIIRYSCCSEEDICDTISAIGESSSLATSKTPGYVGYHAVAGIDHYTFDNNSGMTLWFEIQEVYRGYIGQIVDLVRIESTFTSDVLEYTIDVQSNNPDSDNAVLVTEGAHVYICINIPHLERWESWYVYIGRSEGQYFENGCFINFVIDDSSPILLGGKSLSVTNPIIDVSKTDFGFTTKDGKSTLGIVGNYDGMNLISGFVVKDGFGNRYVSKTDVMEINAFHNDKIELIYG